MRRIALCLIFIGLAVATGTQTIESRQKAEQEVRKAEEARRQALLHNDAAAMERLVADDFVITDNEGRVHDRAEELALYRNARRQTESWEPSDVKVRVYGDMAVVTQRVALQDVLKGQVRNFRMRLTHVWVKRDGRWQCVARHATRISEPPQSTTGVTTSQLERRSSAPPHSKKEASPFSKAEQEINEIREQSRRAFIEGDYDTLDRLWADDYFGTTTWGEIRTKAESLRGLRKGDRKFLSLDYDEIKVRIYGNAAIETGRVTYLGLSGGQKIPGNAHYTLVFIKQPAGWRLVAQQVSNIAPERAASVGASFAADGQFVDTDNAARNVREAERQWNEARLRNDAAALDRLLADDWTAQHIHGELETKAHFIADVKSNEPKYEYINEDEISVHVYGDAAVVAGHIKSKGHLRGEPLGGDMRFTRVWAKRNNRWQMVATQHDDVKVSASVFVKRHGRWKLVNAQDTRIAPTISTNSPASAPVGSEAKNERSPAVTSTSEQLSQAQQEIVQVENERVQAALHGDADGLDRLLANDFVNTTARGEVRTKLQTLTLYRTGEMQMQSLELHDLQIRLYGNTAVVTGSQLWREVFKGEAPGGQARFTRVWLKRDGRWQCVAMQATQLADTASDSKAEQVSNISLPSGGNLAAAQIGKVELLTAAQVWSGEEAYWRYDPADYSFR